MYKLRKETKHAKMREISEQRIAQMTIEEKADFWERICKQWYDMYLNYSSQYFKASSELNDVDEERQKWKIVAMSLGASEDAIDDIELETDDEY
jgi:hypothetical protein